MAGFTITQLEAIERAIASGTLEVHYDGKRVKYQTLDELLRARTAIREDLIGQGLLTNAVGTHGGASVTVFCRD